MNRNKYFIILILLLFLPGCTSRITTLNEREKDQLGNIKVDTDSTETIVKFSSFMPKSSGGGVAKGMAAGSVMGMHPMMWMLGGPILTAPYAAASYSQCSKAFNNINNPEQVFIEASNNVEPSKIFSEILSDSISETTEREYDKNSEIDTVVNIKEITITLDPVMGDLECAFSMNFIVSWEIQKPSESTPLISGISEGYNNQGLLNFIELTNKENPTMREVITGMSHGAAYDFIQRSIMRF